MLKSTFNRELENKTSRYDDRIDLDNVLSAQSKAYDELMKEIDDRIETRSIDSDIIDKVCIQELNRLKKVIQTHFGTDEKNEDVI